MRRLIVFMIPAITVSLTGCGKTDHRAAVNENMYFLGYQSPLGHNGTLHIQDMLDTTIHESLHPFINPGVEQQQDMIQSLAGNKNPADYTSSIYVNMPWYRITDEAIVRAVQARIYREAGTVIKDAYIKKSLRQKRCYAATDNQ